MNSRLIEQDAVASRLAVRLTGALTARAENPPADIEERLRFARDRALARAREVRAAPAEAVGLVLSAPRGVWALGGFVPWWQRAMGVLPLVVLLAGLVGIDRWSLREQVLAAAEIDTQLLSDDLPPSAYSDPGFAEYLRTGPPP